MPASSFFPVAVFPGQTTQTGTVGNTLVLVDYTAASTTPTVPTTGQLWPIGWIEEAEPGGETMPTRTTATITTASLAADAGETGTVTLAPGYRLIRISTDRAARVRLYASTTARTADASRPRGTDPTGDHGVMFDFATTGGDMDWGISPAVDGYLDSVGTAVPYSVTNISGSTGTVTANLTWVQTEA